MSTQRVQTFGKKKTAIATATTQSGKGLIKVGK
jgi:ribosomal protein S9